ncbi:hypothetical protein EV191_11547 [Tamaricihabitans halophyticus]|uniref:Uncharacterized protein n=1 Tax=Tamaricihabitans halophyticus TaxID=1262583 RepID=A0A4R2QA19_9PSEU|nr:DUF6676 family protein [Tamaricihabitans halophyticus]TCP45767.1 hypothetical protein EV191_11547 [Tamaricihabitans halophyticus]
MSGHHIARADAVIAQPAGVDLDEIAADLRDNGVAGDGAQDRIAKVVQQARADHDLELSVVTLPDGTESELQDLAQELALDRGGTVLALSPDSAAAWSADGDSAAAVANLPAGDDAVAAQAFVDELTAPGPPWGWIIGAAVVLIIAVAVVGRWWERRRRRAKDAAALAAEGERLRSEISAMANTVLRLEPLVTVHDDAELSTEFDRLVVRYRELSHTVQKDPTDRRSADTLDARVRDVRANLDQIAETIDGAR